MKIQIRLIAIIVKLFVQTLGKVGGVQVVILVIPVVVVVVVVVGVLLALLLED